MRASVCVCAGYLHHGECATKAMTDDIDELQRCLDAVHIPHSSPTLSVADFMSLQVTHSLSRRSHVSPGHTLSQSPTSCPYKSHTVSVADLMSLQVTHCHLLSLKDTHTLSRRPHVPPSHTLSVADLMSLQVTHCHLLSLKDTHSLSRRPHVPPSHTLS